MVHSYSLTTNGTDLTGDFDLTANDSLYYAGRNSNLVVTRGGSFTLEFDFTRTNAYANGAIVHTGYGQYPHQTNPTNAPTYLGRILIGTEFTYTEGGGLLYVKGFESETSTTQVSLFNITSKITTNKKYTMKVVYDATTKTSNYYLDGTLIGTLSNYEILIDGLYVDSQNNTVESLKLYK